MLLMCAVSVSLIAGSPGAFGTSTTDGIGTNAALVGLWGMCVSPTLLFFVEGNLGLVKSVVISSKYHFIDIDPRLL